jgi:hypothetical protein
VDLNAYKQINLSAHQKADVIGAWMRFIVGTAAAVERDKSTVIDFVAQSNDVTVRQLAESDEWIMEHVARLFWMCCELGLLEYQYSYPHIGQTYRPTRLGKIVAALPRGAVRVFIWIMSTAATVAGPVKHFARVRNTSAAVVALVTWYFKNDVTAAALAMYAVIAGVVSTWLAHFLSASDD